MKVLEMKDIDLNNKRVLIREDFNVPIHEGQITSDVRIRTALPTIELALEQNAAIILISHRGRPKEGEYNAQFSLQLVADKLAELLNKPVRFEKEWLHGVDCQTGEIVLCENVRFNKGEKANDEQLAKQMASLCDVFVMDAFGSAHRAHASTHGVARFAPIACAGPLLCSELNALATATKQAQSPILAIVGGSKVSSKLSVLHTLAEKVDQLIVGGGIANTFIAACGHNVGKSLYEPDLIDEAKTLIEKSRQAGNDIPIPTDVVVAKEFSEQATATIKTVDQVADDDLILDIGPQTRQQYQQIIKNSATIVWNGPVGVFEFDAFGEGTKAMAEAIATSDGFSIAGGGDTLAAIAKYNITYDVSYISTGGGAFLEYLEGKTLPALDILEQRAAETVN